MSHSHNIIESKACLICGGFMSSTRRYLNPSGEETIVYQCNSMLCCDLPPYTRYTITYTDGERVSEQIIIKIEDQNYCLAFNSKKNITTLNKMQFFIEPVQEYVVKEICELNYVIEWYDVLSAYRIISRLLKIKVFS